MPATRTSEREPTPTHAPPPPSGVVAPRSALRAAGLRSTAPRLAVLELLGARREPLSHADVFAALGDEGFDRTTLYRNLINLAEAGLAVRVNLGDHVWRFSLARDDAASLHFLCIACGSVQALPEDAVKLVMTPNTPRALSRKDIAVQVKGRCDGCA